MLCLCKMEWYSVSSTFKLCGGVGHGGILSPILFILYVNDIIEDMHRRGRVWVVEFVTDRLCRLYNAG